MSWLVSKGLGGLQNWIWLAAGLLAITIAMKVATNWFDSAQDTAKDAGRSEAIIEGQNTTLEQIGDANDAADQIRRDVGFARYCQCLRDAAEGFAASCQREIKDKSLLDDDEATAAACFDPPR